MLVNTNIISKTTLAENPEQVYTRDYLYPPPTANELSALTCHQLQERLRDRQMPISGKKQELIDRLIQSDDTIPESYHEIDAMMSSSTEAITPNSTPLKSVQVSDVPELKSPASLNNFPAPVPLAVETAESKPPASVVAVDAAKLKSPPAPVVAVVETVTAVAGTAAANAAAANAAAANAAAADAAAVDVAAAGAELKTNETSAAAVVIPNTTSLKRSQAEVVDDTTLTSSEKKTKHSSVTTTEVPSTTVHPLQKCNLETYDDNDNRTPCEDGQICVDVHQLAAERPGAQPDIAAVSFHGKQGQAFVGPTITGVKESKEYFPGIMVGYKRTADDPNKVLGDGEGTQWRPTYILMCHMHNMKLETFHQDMVTRCNSYASNHIGEGHGHYMYPVEFIKGDINKNPIVWNELLNTKSVMRFLKKYYKNNTLEDIIADDSVMIRFFGSVEVGRERLHSKKALWNKL